MHIASKHSRNSGFTVFNKYDELFSDLDVDKAKDFLEKKLGHELSKRRDVIMAAGEYLRNIILNGI